MKVSIIIPNYNGRHLLEKNLPKILSVVSEVEVIVVDDASTDGSVKEIKYQISKINNAKKKTKIRLIINEKNLGFSSTVNRGVKEAEGDYVLLLNSDVVPKKDFLEPLLSHFKDEKVFAVGCLQRYQVKDETVLRGRGIGKFEKGFLIHGPGKIDRKNTLWVFGGAGLFRKEIWLRFSGMDMLYDPFYWEDIDLSYRALKAGFNLIFEPKSVVDHYEEKGAVRNNYSSYEVRKIAFRNQILFVWLNITDSRYLIEHFLFLPFYLLKAIVVADYTFVYGFILALKNLSLVFKHRLRNKKLYKKRDKEVLKVFAAEF